MVNCCRSLRTMVLLLNSEVKFGSWQEMQQKRYTAETRRSAQRLRTAPPSEQSRLLGQGGKCDHLFDHLVYLSPACCMCCTQIEWVYFKTLTPCTPPYPPRFPLACHHPGKPGENTPASASTEGREHMFTANACPVDCPFVKHKIAMATDQTAFISFFLLRMSLLVLRRPSMHFRCDEAVWASYATPQCGLTGMSLDSDWK